MFVDITDSIPATGSGTGIQTTLTQTGAIKRTIRIADALGSAAWILLGIWPKAGITKGHSIAVHRTNVMRSTGRRSTRIPRNVLQYSNGNALQKGVADEAVQAKTYWRMLAHITDGINSTDRSGTWIHALVVNARQGITAIGVNVALRLASRLRIAQVTWDARTNSAVI